MSQGKKYIGKHLFRQYSDGRIGLYIQDTDDTENLVKRADIAIVLPCKNFFSPFPAFARTSFMRTSLCKFLEILSSCKRGSDVCRMASDEKNLSS